MSQELTRAWELSQTWKSRINDREGTFCLRCGAQPRIQALAAALADTYSCNLPLNKSLNGLSDTKIAEINACGSLHRALKNLPYLTYSEYMPKRKDIQKEDVTKLSYPNSSFDCVIHSETMEHVPDTIKAFSEIHRILKPDGYTIFTIPIIPDGRPTKQRAKIDPQGNLIHLHPPSFHGPPWAKKEDYLVFWEFGSDIIPVIESTGFSCQLSTEKDNPSICVVTAHWRQPKMLKVDSTRDFLPLRRPIWMCRGSGS
jgi:SAM-dependent methyltransferase